MNNAHSNIGPSSTSTAVVGRHSIATSLFGGAILATVATASLAQMYFPTAIALAGGMVSSGYVGKEGRPLAFGRSASLDAREHIRNKSVYPPLGKVGSWRGWRVSWSRGSLTT